MRTKMLTERLKACENRGSYALLRAIELDGQPIDNIDPDRYPATLKMLAAGRAHLDSLILNYIRGIEDDHIANIPPALKDRQRDEDRKWWQEEVATALNISRWDARRHARTAQVLSKAAPLTQAGLSEGLISLNHAHTIGENLDGLTPEQAGQLDEELMAATLGQSLTATQLKGKAERARATIDPPAAEETQENVDDRRSLDLWRRKEDGMGHVSGWLTPEAAAALEAVLTPLAEPLAADDERTKTQRWHDALVEACSRLLIDGGLTDSNGAAASMQVLVPLDTLQGGGAPGEIPRHGLISPEAARRLSCSACWNAVITSPDNHHALFLGRTQRLPNRALRRFLRARDGHCQFAGCTIAAERCEPHHVVTWGNGGHTDPDNCVLVCSRHHHAAHEGGWKVVRTKEGATVWTSPAGLSHTVNPPDLHAGLRPLRDAARSALLRHMQAASVTFHRTGDSDSEPNETDRRQQSSEQPESSATVTDPGPLPLPSIEELAFAGVHERKPRSCMTRRERRPWRAISQENAARRGPPTPAGSPASPGSPEPPPSDPSDPIDDCPF